LMRVHNLCAAPSASIAALGQWLVCTMLAVALVAGPRCADSQASSGAPPDADAYGFRMAVDEVGLTFHAADMHGLPINDLRPDELRLLDNGSPPRRILAFYSMQDYPIRAGILMDTSESMDEHVRGNRAIATEYAQRMLRQQTDKAFVVEFGYVSKITQTWTGDPAVLTTAIRGITAGRENPLGGTALFDAIFSACFHQFGKTDHAASGNFILLFSDGEDNTSHTSLQEAVDVCQRANTAVYAFRSEPNSSLSSGPKTLAELARQTGGRVFHAGDSQTEIDSDLRTIEADLRNEYRLVYKPAELKHDGSFHRIVLLGPDRVESIQVRSGYYAPVR
jgi:Ca-activated chloride channel homolog